MIIIHHHSPIQYNKMQYTRNAVPVFTVCGACAGQTLIATLQWREAEGRRKMCRTAKYKFVHDAVGGDLVVCGRASSRPPPPPPPFLVTCTSSAHWRRRWHRCSELVVDCLSRIVAGAVRLGAGPLRVNQPRPRPGPTLPSCAARDDSAAGGLEYAHGRRGACAAARRSPERRHISAK